MASSGDIIRSYLGCSTDLFTVIGVACAAYFGLNSLCTISKWIKTYCLARSLGLSTNLQRLGEWAVITGATDGIGKAYAEQLAGRGMNIVLISRSQSKLEITAKEIESKFKVKTKIIPADFSLGTAVYKQIQEDLAALEIGVLVNNVGMSYSFPGKLLDWEDREKLFMDLIHVNITSLTMMTSIVLPSMVERKKGAVINISSLSGVLPTPLLTVYSSAKSYTRFFSVCLKEEYKGQGITVQCVCPGFVATKMAGIKKESLMAPFPSTFVRSALGTVGVESMTYGYWSHSIMALAFWLTPGCILKRVMSSVLSASRKRALKKQARDNKAE